MRTSNPGVARPKPLGRESLVGPRKAPDFSLRDRHANALTSSPGHTITISCLCSLHPRGGWNPKRHELKSADPGEAAWTASVAGGPAAFSGQQHCCSGMYVNPSVLPTCYLTCKMFSKNFWKALPLRPIILIPLEAWGQLPAHTLRVLSGDSPNSPLPLVTLGE